MPQLGKAQYEDEVEENIEDESFNKTNKTLTFGKDQQQQNQREDYIDNSGSIVKIEASMNPKMSKDELEEYGRRLLAQLEEAEMEEDDYYDQDY